MDDLFTEPGVRLETTIGRPPPEPRPSRALPRWAWATPLRMTVTTLLFGAVAFNYALGWKVIGYPAAALVEAVGIAGGVRGQPQKLQSHGRGAHGRSVEQRAADALPLQLAPDDEPLDFRPVRAVLHGGAHDLHRAGDPAVDQSREQH